MPRLFRRLTRAIKSPTMLTRRDENCISAFDRWLDADLNRYPREKKRKTSRQAITESIRYKGHLYNGQLVKITTFTKHFTREAFLEASSLNFTVSLIKDITYTSQQLDDADICLRRENDLSTSQIDSKCIISQLCCGWISLCSDDETRATIRKEDIQTDPTTLPRKVKLPNRSSCALSFCRFLENALRHKHW